ncbi:hypothetical protein [Paraburkholderia sp. RL17-373-BIF-A]|uniref:hypothetical protein n=1 Tax=Paraburkholderia sp. RL17-373-BIF-A TaxID=3031629 RepID=UPI0038B799A3
MNGFLWLLLVWVVGIYAYIKGGASASKYAEENAADLKRQLSEANSEIRERDEKILHYGEWVTKLELAFYSVQSGFDKGRDPDQIWDDFWTEFEAETAERAGREKSRHALIAGRIPINL